jgi:DNA-directed RNA polymerase subunit alpha
MKAQVDALNNNIRYLERHLVATFDAERESVFKQDVTILNLSVRTANVIKTMNIKTIGELVGHTEYSLLRQNNFGRRSLNELKHELLPLGLKLDMIVYDND